MIALYAEIDRLRAENARLQLALKVTARALVAALADQIKSERKPALPIFQDAENRN